MVALEENEKIQTNMFSVGVPLIQTIDTTQVATIVIYSIFFSYNVIDLVR